MSGLGGVGAFAEGFTKNFVQGRTNRRLREEAEARGERADRQEKRLEKEHELRLEQAEALKTYREGQAVIQQKQLAIQQRAGDLAVAEKFMGILDPKVPRPVRDLMLKKFAPALGIDPKSEQFRDISKMLGQLDSDTLSGIRSTLGVMLPEAQPGQITSWAQAVLNGQMEISDLGKVADEARKSAAAKAKQQDLQKAYGEAPVDGDKDPKQLRATARQLLSEGHTAEGLAALQAARDLEGGGEQGTTGPIPSGWEMYHDPQGNRRLRPMAGSDAEREQEREKARVGSARQAVETSGEVVIQDLGRAMEMLDADTGWRTGAPAALLSRVPGTPAYDINRLLQTAASNVAIDRLQAIRLNSPTGAALGNVTDQEGQRLERLFGSLDITQNREVLLDNIKRISNIYADTVHGTTDQILELVSQGEVSAEDALPLIERFELSFDERGRPRSKKQKPTSEADHDKLPRPASKAEFDRLPSGTDFIDSDGRQRRKP